MRCLGRNHTPSEDGRLILVFAVGEGIEMVSHCLDVVFVDGFDAFVGVEGIRVCFVGPPQRILQKQQIPLNISDSQL